MRSKTRNQAALLLISAALVAPQFSLAASAPPAPNPAVPGSPEQACQLSEFKGVASDVRIRSAQLIAAPRPYCRVDGEVETRNPGPNTVGFMIALPENWNGRYLMVIPGGSAGQVFDPSNEHISLGYAVATTDKGSHSTGPIDMSFRADPAKSEDWAKRGAHVAAQASQAIVRSYYSRAKFPRYIMGCSGGGLSTLTEAENYPEDADGFIAGAAPSTPEVQTFWAYIAQYLSADPERWISPELMRRVGEVILAKYDGADGAEDGLIWNPKKIVLTKSIFPFLSEKQFETLKVLETGLPSVDGVAGSAPGYWLSNPSILSELVLGVEPPPWTERSWPPLYGSTVTTMRVVQGQAFNPISAMDYFSPTDRLAERKIWDRVGGYDIDPSKLSKLASLNARLITWSGAADEAIPPAYVELYNKQARAALGEKSKEFLQSFLVPGMFHCRGGEGNPTDVWAGMLNAMERWVEAGERPDQVILTNAPRDIELGTTSNTSRTASGMSAARRDPPVLERRTYRICAYPAFAKFAPTSGETNEVRDFRDSSNWNCEPEK